jgi:transposase-like protein
MKVCKECGSSHVVKSGIAVTRKGKKQRWQCRECGLVFCEENEIKRPEASK